MGSAIACSVAIVSAENVVLPLPVEPDESEECFPVFLVGGVFSEVVEDLGIAFRVPRVEIEAIDASSLVL